MRIERKRNKNPLRYGFYLILVVFAGFMIAGLFNRSLKIESYIKIEKPVAEIIPYLIQPELLSNWIGEVKNINIVKGETGKEGSIYDINYKDGQKSQLTFVTINLENYVFSYLLESDITDITVSIKTEELEDGTTDIIQTSIIEGKDLLTKSILLFLKNMYTHDSTGKLERLKYELENS